jgi:hypothetical protein
MTADATLKVLGGLLLANSALHVVTAALGAPAGMALPLIVFGLIYGALGLWTRGGQRTALIVTALIAGLGLTLGASRYLVSGGPIAVPVMGLLDLAVIAACLILLLRRRTTG